METRFYQGRFIGTPELGIKPISSLEIIEPNYLLTSSFTLTDSEQLPSRETNTRLLDLTPLHQSIEIPSYQISVQPPESQQNQYKKVNDNTVPAMVAPSIEHILFQNLKKEEIQKMTSKFIYNLNDILKKEPQCCSVEIKTSDFTNPPYPFESSTSIEQEQKGSPIMINIDPGSFRVIPLQRQKSKSIEKTQESEGQDNLQMRRDLKQENERLQRVLAFLKKRAKDKGTKIRGMDLTTLKSCIKEIGK